MRSAANESLSARITDVRRFDFDEQRLSILRRSAGPDGEILGESGQFANATTACNWFGGEVQCTASGFDRRQALGESVRSELGPNPSLRRATLLVAPDGRIVEYRFTLERDDGSGENAERVVLERTYRTSTVNATTVSRPAWLEE